MANWIVPSETVEKTLPSLRFLGCWIDLTAGQWEPATNTPTHIAETARTALRGWEAAAIPATSTEILAMLGKAKLHYATGQATLTAEQWRQVFADYVSDLGDLPIDILADAIAAHRRDPEHGSFWPKVADIRRHADPLLVERRRTVGRLRQLAARKPAAFDPKSITPEQQAERAAAVAEIMAKFRSGARV